MSSVQVVVRLRPMNENEKKEGTLPVIKAKTNEKSVTVIKGHGPRQARSTFSFDNVFTAFSTQAELFDETVKPVIRDVMQGYESTVFAYGQTGTGKTYTMEGNLSSPEHYGVIPRSAQAIFEALKKPEFASHHVVCTYLEIYNEELGDLLADDITAVSSTSTPMKGRSSLTSSSTPMKDRTNTTNMHGKKLEIMNGKNGTFCRGLTEREVHSASDVLGLMQSAQQLRKIGETKMNKESSRSHCVFSIIINAQRKLNDGSTFEFSGKLHMVDLAGSECAKTAALDKASGNEVARERERMNINRSLLTLGRVIKTLKEQSTTNKKLNNVRIPYRDSKLTRVLQESLGGRCKTLIIATLSPSITAIEESTSTLNYAQAANGIVNKPVSSAYLSLGSSHSCSMESGSTEPNTIEHWQEMECRLEYMQTQVEEAKAALARKHIQQQELVERAEKAEIAASEMENKYLLAQEEIKNLNKAVEKEKMENQIISNLLQETKSSLRKSNAILEATQRTEVALTAEANDILIALEQSLRDGDELHRLLSEARDNDILKRTATKKFRDASVSMLLNVIDQMDTITKCSNEFEKSVEEHITSEAKSQHKTFSSFFKKLNDTKSKITCLANEIECLVMNEDGMKKTLVDASLEATEQIELSKSLLIESEKNLHDSMQKTLIEVSKSSDDLRGRHNIYLKSSDQFLSQFESNIATVKEKVCTMVSNATEYLSTVRNTNTQTRDSLVNVLQQLSSSCEKYGLSTRKITVDHRKQINSTDNMFKNSNTYHGDMVEYLEKQNLLINSVGQEHINEINCLNQIIKDQKATFDKAYDEQQRAHKEALTNMFTGMQALLETEMKRISEKTDNICNTFTASNGNILELNKSIRSSASHIIQDVKKNNEKMVKTVTTSQSNNDSIQKIVQESKSALTKIEDLADEGQKQNEVHLKEAMGKVQNLAKVDSDVNLIQDKLIHEGEAIERYASDTIVCEAQKGIAQLSQNNQNNIDFTVNTVLAKLQKDLNEIEAPRAQISNGITSNLHQVATCLDETATKILPQFDKQSQKAEEISKTLSSYQQAFENISTRYCDDSQKKNKALASASSTFKSNAVYSIAKCKEDLATTKDSVGDFSTKDIQVEEAVQPLFSRSTITYSSNFTSTPNTDVILKKIVDNEDYLNNDSISVKSEISCLSSTEGSTMQDLSQSSELLQIISEQKSSPLMELSLNKENFCDNNSNDILNHPPRHGKKRPTKRTDLKQHKGASKRRKERI